MNQVKKLRSQDLPSDNNSSKQFNSLCNMKTVILETNQKDSTETSEEEAIYNSSNMNISEIIFGSKLLNNLLFYNQKVEQGLRYKLYICVKNNNNISTNFQILISENIIIGLEIRQSWSWTICPKANLILEPV